VLGPEVLLGEVAGDLVGLLPGGSPDRARAVLAGAGAVVGTEQPVEAAATSWAHARALLALLAGRDGGAPPGPQGTAVSVVADDHLADLAVAADRSLVQALRRIALAPLSGLPPPRRQVLEGTLRSWLEHHGNRPAVALELVVHPQTVSYRMARLRALFGDRLDDPQARFGLQVALHAGPAGPVHPAGGQAPH
jgi:DNA-binding PucR family transcriptional regulator